MASPHPFTFLAIDATRDWSLAAQRALVEAQQVTWRGVYGVRLALARREHSPDPAQVLLTPNGVLQVCLRDAPPFENTAPQQVRTMRANPSRRACPTRPALLETLATAFLDYEHTRQRMQAALLQDQAEALQALAVLDRLLSRIAVLRKRKALPSTGARVASTKTLRTAHKQLTAAVQALPGDTAPRLAAAEPVKLWVTQVPLCRLVQALEAAWHQHVPKMPWAEIHLATAALLQHFAVIPCQPLHQSVDNLRKLRRRVQPQVLELLQ
jgi:hypothetical protein